MTIGSTMSTRPMCVPEASATPRQASGTEDDERPRRRSPRGSCRGPSRAVDDATRSSRHKLIAHDCRTRTPQTHFPMAILGATASMPPMVATPRARAQMNALQYVNVLWRRKMTVLLCVLVAVGGMLIIDTLRPNVYTATAKVALRLRPEHQPHGLAHRGARAPATPGPSGGGEDPRAPRALVLDGAAHGTAIIVTQLPGEHRRRRASAARQRDGHTASTRSAGLEDRGASRSSRSRRCTRTARRSRRRPTSTSSTSHT